MALRLIAIDKRFGRHIALDGVTIHVRQGDCYGFLGHNGAGKTTALRIALGLIPADGGRVLVEGFDAVRYPREARARQGGLIETPGFYGWLSGRENLALLAGLDGMDRSRARSEAARLLDVVGLARAADRKVGGYSQGMRQRLGIAQALLGDPALILLDEPMNGLDPEGIEEFRRLIAALVRDHDRTVIFSSHQIHEVAGICNRVGILRQGRVIVEAETSALLAAGGARYVLRTADDAAAQRALAECGIAHHATPAGTTFDPAAAPPGRVARELVARNIDIVELAPQPVSLEEIYLRYSRGDSGLPAPAASAPAASAPAASAPAAAAAAPAAAPVKQLAPRRPVLRAAALECRRLASHYGPFIALGLPVLLAALSILRQWAAAAGHMQEVQAGELFSHSLVTAFEAATVALAGALPLAAVIFAGLASQSIAAEYSHGTLRNLLLLPVGRLPLALGKALGSLSAALIGYIVLCTAAIGGAAVAFDFTDVVEIMEIRTAEPWVVVEARALWPLFLKMVPLLFLPLAAYTALGFLAGAATKKSATALSVAVGAVVFFDLARTVGRHFHFERIMLSAYLPSPLGDTSLAANLLDRIRAPNDPPGGYAGSAFWIPLAWTAVAVLLSMLIVGRRSVP